MSSEDLFWKQAAKIGKYWDSNRALKTALQNKDRIIADLQHQIEIKDRNYRRIQGRYKSCWLQTNALKQQIEQTKSDHSKKIQSMNKTAAFEAIRSQKVNSFPNTYAYAERKDDETGCNSQKEAIPDLTQYAFNCTKRNRHAASLDFPENPSYTNKKKKMKLTNDNTALTNQANDIACPSQRIENSPALSHEANALANDIACPSQRIENSPALSHEANALANDIACPSQRILNTPALTNHNEAHVTERDNSRAALNSSIVITGNSPRSSSSSPNSYDEEFINGGALESDGEYIPEQEGESDDESEDEENEPLISEQKHQEQDKPKQQQEELDDEKDQDDEKDK